jgi:hypothetical protein
MYRGEFSSSSPDPVALLVKARGGFFEDEPKLTRRTRKKEWNISGWDEVDDEKKKTQGDLEMFVHKCWQKWHIKSLSKRVSLKFGGRSNTIPEDDEADINQEREEQGWSADGNDPSLQGDSRTTSSSLPSYRPAPLGLSKRRAKPRFSRASSKRLSDKPQSAALRADPKMGPNSPTNQLGVQIDSAEGSVDLDVEGVASEDASQLDSPDEQSDDENEKDNTFDEKREPSESDGEDVDRKAARHKGLEAVRTDHLFHAIDGDSDNEVDDGKEFL